MSTMCSVEWQLSSLATYLILGELEQWTSVMLTTEITTRDDASVY